MAALVAAAAPSQTRPDGLGHVVCCSASRPAVSCRTINARLIHAINPSRVLALRQPVRRLTVAAVPAAAVAAAAAAGGSSGGPGGSPLQALGSFVSANFIPVGLVLAITIG
jgi:hypothetical protein